MSVLESVIVVLAVAGAVAILAWRVWPRRKRRACHGDAPQRFEV